MAEEKKIATGLIGNALRSSAADHTTTFTDEIFDTERQKYQNEVNTDLETTDNEIKADLEAEKARATAAEKAIIFDVSEHNNGAVFESLQALLSSSNLSTLIPTSVRHGGVTIRFIQGSDQSSDNKYVQYRLMTASFTTDVTQWQGADKEPIPASPNFVESSGIFDSIYQKLDKAVGKNIFNKNTPYKKEGYYAVGTTGYYQPNSDVTIYVVPVVENVDIAINLNYVNVCAVSVFPDFSIVEKGVRIEGYLGGIGTDDSHRTYHVPTGTKYLLVSPPNPNTIQVEYGTTPTTYEAYKEGVKKEDVFGLDSEFADIDNQITVLNNELSKKASYSTGKNLFNKNTANKKLGVYINHKTHKLSTLANWGAYVVEVQAGDVLSFNKGNIHVCAFSEYVDISQLSVGDTIGNYIEGFADESAKQGWTVPNGCVMLTVSVSDSDVNALQIEKGSTSTAYEPYIEGIPANEIIGFDSNKTLYVGVGQQYTTIQSAVNAALDGDTIIVMPGTYNEAVEVYGETGDIHTSTKDIRIIGVNRDECILTHSSADYYEPPLEIAKGYIENMTIKATGTTLAGGASQFAYCVHIDYNAEENSALQFVNCNFENDVRNCVGIGMRQNFTISFIGCRFVSHYGDGAVYCHEQGASNKINQRIELIDCTLYLDGPKGTYRLPDSDVDRYSTGVPLWLQEATENTGNEEILLIQRCILKSKYGFLSEGKAVYIRDITTSSEASGGDKWLGSHSWNIDPMSDLNNESIVNA